MSVTFKCPACQTDVRCLLDAQHDTLVCPHCSWSRPQSGAAANQSAPDGCLVCGCNDLWRQKDFPQRLGITLVAIGALLSTIAWYYRWPVVAIGILMLFALFDLLLYTFMNDVLVCYRCSAQYRRFDPETDHTRFNLEIAERYRQEAMRLEDAAESRGQLANGSSETDPVANKRTIP